MEMERQKLSTLNSMIVFNILDELRNSKLREMGKDEWDKTLAEILDKRVIRENIDRLLRLEEMSKEVSKVGQKMKFIILGS